MKKKKLVLALCMFCALINNAATIVYRQYGAPRMRKKLTDVTLVKINWRYVSFTHNGKAYKIQRKWMDAFIPDTVTASNIAKTPNAGTVKAPETSAEKKEVKKESFPTSIAAYILHGRYLFGVGQSDGWYYGKQIVVSGVVELKDIKPANKADLLGTKALGQYQVPMLNGAIICLTNDRLSSLTTIKSAKEDKYAKVASKQYAVMKFKGTVAKSSRYKEAFINNAKLISSRFILSSRNCKQITSGDKRVTNSQQLARTDSLQYSAYLEQKNSGIGRIKCNMGTDPEAYAMEIYWLKKLYKPARKLMLTVSGTPHGDSNKFRKLDDCSIVRWSVLTN